MPSLLTEHVRSFAAESKPADGVLPEIERLLRYHMRNKRLLSLPPHRLGYSGAPSWTTPGALEDIVVDCYIFAVLDRLTALQNQLRLKPNVDGLISRNVSNFLIERRRRHDPIGYAVFGTVCGAVRMALAAKAATVDSAAGEKPNTSTVVRLYWESSPAAPVVAPEALRPAVASAAGWSAALAHLTETTEEGREWLFSFLLDLPRQGVSAVRLGDLAAALAERVRADWQARHGEPGAVGREMQDEVVATVRIVMPNDELESRDRWELIKRVVPERIARLDRQERVRSRLAAVFAALVAAVEAGDSSTSQADLIARTGVPRATLSDDFRVLREIVSNLDEKNSE